MGAVLAGHHWLIAHVAQRSVCTGTPEPLTRPAQPPVHAVVAL